MLRLVVGTLLVVTLDAKSVEGKLVVAVLNEAAIPEMVINSAYQSLFDVSDCQFN